MLGIFPNNSRIILMQENLSLRTKTRLCAEFGIFAYISQSATMPEKDNL